MIPTVSQLKQISLSAKPNVSNIRSIITGLHRFGDRYGLLLPHRLGHYIPQLAHESGHFGYDKEIWGNTKAQQRYDVRTDLGNTKARDGDGKKYMGRTGMMLTGKANYTAFWEWCKDEGYNPPNFVESPDLINNDPWEGLVPIWFWSVGNRTGKSLNIYADKNDPEMITKIINGGLNGYGNRLEYITRTALVFLGHSVAKSKIASSIKTVQEQNNLVVDGIDGPRTRAKLHEALVNLDRAAIARTPDIKVSAAPVVEEKKVATAPEATTKPAKDIWTIIVMAVLGAGGSVFDFFGNLPQAVQLSLIGAIVVAAGFLIWSRVDLSRVAKRIYDEVQEQNNGLAN